MINNYKENPKFGASIKTVSTVHSVSILYFKNHVISLLLSKLICLLLLFVLFVILYYCIHSWKPHIMFSLNRYRIPL